MDVSKLPKLSDTQKEQQAQAAAVAGETAATNDPPIVQYAPRQEDRQSISVMGGAEAWLSIAIGVIILLIDTNRRLLHYYLARSSFTWTFSDSAGAPLPYPKTIFFWGDFAMVAFGLVLIIEGLVLGFAPRRGLIAMAFALTVAATLLNFGYIAFMISGGYGFQIPSALAVVFGLYISSYEWRLLRAMRPSVA